MSALVAVVPVRGGSKGLPGKNLRAFGPLPLWEHAAHQGLDAGAGRVLVTTDIPGQLAPTRDRIDVVGRDAALAQDDTPMGPVLMDLLGRIEGAATIVLLQPTSPLRQVEDIVEAVALYRGGGHDLVMSVTPADRGVLKYGTLDQGRFTAMRDQAHCFTNRQSLPDVMRPNGAVYVFDKDWFLANGGFATDAIGAHIMPSERSIDIDDDADFRRALQAAGFA